MFLHNTLVPRSTPTPTLSSSTHLVFLHYSSTAAVLQHQLDGKGLGLGLGAGAGGVIGVGGFAGDGNRGRKGNRLNFRVHEAANFGKKLKSRFGDGRQGVGGGRVLATLKEEEFLTKAQEPSDSSSSSSSGNGSVDGSHADTVSSMEGKSLWRKLAQNVNVSGVSFSARVIVKERHLAIPHVNVPDISWIDWKALKVRGFEGVVFDKDNTLTCPYEQKIWPPLGDSLEECREVFGGRIALLSNSAGLYQYDPHGAEAKRLENRLGIPVIRHGQKKPAGNALAVSNHFSCDPSMLIMVGDRYFTDVVYGNSNGLLTIRPAPLTTRGEPFIVKRVRTMEEALVDWWRRRGFLPPKHQLFDNPVEFIKDPGCW